VQNVSGRRGKHQKAHRELQEDSVGADRGAGRASDG